MGLPRSDRLVIVDFLSIKNKTQEHEEFLNSDLRQFLDAYLSRPKSCASFYEHISGEFSEDESELVFKNQSDCIALDRLLKSLSEQTTKQSFDGTVLIAIPFSNQLAEYIYEFSKSDSQWNVEDLDPYDVLGKQQEVEASPKFDIKNALRRTRRLVYSSYLETDPGDISVLERLLRPEAIPDTGVAKGKSLSARHAAFLACLLWKKVSQSGRAILAVNRPTTLDPEVNRLIERIDKKVKCRGDHQFLNSVYEASRPEFYTTILGRQLFEFNPKPKDIQLNRFLVEPEARAWKASGLSPKGDEYDRWLIQEFGTRSTARHFLEVSYDALLKLSLIHI